MPQLPRDQEIKDSEVMNKGGSLLVKPQKKPLKLPKKSVVSMLVVVVVLGGIYIFANRYFPTLLKQNGVSQSKTAVFVYPVDANDIVYPSDVLKEQFLANYKNASLEINVDKRYKLLEADFVLLRGFYAANANYNYRLNIEKYKTYMMNNYPAQFKANTNLYNYLCIDKQCGEVKNPVEIAGIRNEIANEPVINNQVKEAVFRNFDGAGLNESSQSASFYLSAYSMMVSESKRTSDSQVKQTTIKLYNFIIKNFPDIQIPDDLKL